MFKLESYITPVILSYVEKYVKNFKPEQSQVSLWGGDASFQNLDLRLEVLEEQLNLPFSFVSGHIHELLIHVPWVKINSEPIVITINTIECILKLKNEKTENPQSSVRSKRKELLQEEAPPGYIRSMITRVINNITINCNNLILKYVEEDIVLSINVRFLSMQTANHKWQPVFTDVGSYEVNLQKIITVQDLTLCLDKMDTSGKIEIYQDPVLYRCSIIIRLMMNYHSNTAKRASVSRLDLHCEKMEFSVTEQQIPMLLRLFALVLALQTKQFPIEKDKTTSEDDRESIGSDEVVLSAAAADGWGGWAWNMVSSFLPVDWDTDWSAEQQIAYSGHTIHFGIYVDEATVTFKSVESIKEQIFYKSRKIRYQSFLSLKLTGVVIDTLLQGVTMTSFQAGFGSIKLYPKGHCPCGYHELVDGFDPPLYVTAGHANADYLKDTLFDAEAMENQGRRRIYKQGIECHLANFTDSKLLEKCPAFVMDYVYFIDLPENITAEKMFEFGPSLEYSNLKEDRRIRYIFGNLTIRLCSGLVHRFDSIKEAASKYNYHPYIVLKPEPTVDELPPVTVEEYEALRENIPMVKVELVVNKGSIEFQLADHKTVLPRQRKSLDSRQTETSTPTLSDDPFISFDWDKVYGISTQPFYPFRLISCASKQTDIPAEMLFSCYRVVELEADGISSQLYLTKNCRISTVMPFSVKLNYKSLLYPQYWKSLEIVHRSLNVHSDSLTITGTKRKVIVVIAILSSVLNPDDPANLIACSSVLKDACEETSPIYLETFFENVNFKNVTTLTTVSNKANVGSIKIFAHNESQQAFILSGPEDDGSVSEERLLFTAVMQYSKDSAVQIHPPILSLHLGEMTGCLDPLLLNWLEYKVTFNKPKSPKHSKGDNQKHVSEGTLSESGSRRRTFRSLHESVHSSSDKEKKKIDCDSKFKLSPKIEEDSKFITAKISNKENKSVLTSIMKIYSWWKDLIVNVCIEHITIYTPSMTMSGIGADGIIDAKDRALKSEPNLQILVTKMPSMCIRSANVQSEILLPYLKRLPAVLPKSMWTKRIHSFPWTLDIVDFQCYTVKGTAKNNFIKNVSFNATIDLTSKIVNEPEEKELSSINLCVYIDMSPIMISICEQQVLFLHSIATNLISTINNISSSNGNRNKFTNSNDQHEIALVAPSSSPAATQLLYLEEETTTSTISTVKDETEPEEENLLLTACVQWTITKFTLKMYVLEDEILPVSKLVLELEDIITSVEMHQVYLKLKHKITTAAIFHYTRSPQSKHWDFGEYVDGLLLCSREDSVEKGEDLGFLSFILTVAKSRNVYTRWGTNKPCKTQKKHTKIDAVPSSENYIAEIVVAIQTLDVIFPLDLLSKYVTFLKPFLNTHGTTIETQSNINDTFFVPPFIGITSLKNDTLPLIYLEFKGFRLMVPAAGGKSSSLPHDLLMIQLDDIKISPLADNPICRIPLRSDIYQLASQANILNIPGSAVEDRQYQINVHGICAFTTTWKNYQQSVRKRISQSYLYTINENPAVEWNKMDSRSPLETHFSTFSMITRFDFCFLIAPIIVFKPDIVVCSAAAEINCMTDIEMAVNMDQLKLISTLATELQKLFVKNADQPVETGGSSKMSLRLATLEDCDIDYAKDSGVDFEMSSLNSISVGKPASQEVAEFPAYEFLMNCGKITFSLYEVKKNHDLINSNTDEEEVLKHPLLCAMINQPNLYISQQKNTQKIQASCFDVALSLARESECLTSIPTRADYRVLLVETKSGELHPDTGIPPSFLTLKCETVLGKNPQFNINLGRPIKIHFSLSRLTEIQSIKQKVLFCLPKSLSKTAEPKPPEPKTEKRLTVADMHLSTSQMVLSFETETKTELIMSLASLTCSVIQLVKPDRIYQNFALNSLVISVNYEAQIKVLLNPWCCNITVCFLWESWKDVCSKPQVQVQADSDSLYLDFGPKHIMALREVWLEYQDQLLGLTKKPSEEFQMQEEREKIMMEQHYKDDLKSGVFQFVDGAVDDVTYPYQVIFVNYPQQAMAWRYPQPRTLTRIHVSPVPFEAWHLDGLTDNKIPCVIEYWSEIQMCYLKYLDFYLSETDSYRVELADKPPVQAASYVWRIVLCPTGPTSTKTLVATRALVACLRIDSYFNPTIIPNFQAALNIGTIHLSLFNHVDEDSYVNLPEPLQEYNLAGKIPQVQCFACLEHNKATFVYTSWSSGSSLIDVGGILRVHVLDYGLLTMQEVLDSLDEKLLICKSEKVTISLTAKPFSLKLSPAISHTLATSLHLWNSVLNESNKTTVILTRYVVANDMSVPIRFGQSGTNEAILLYPRRCHFYSWKSPNNKNLRVSIKKENGWIWSKPCSVNSEGMDSVDIGSATISIQVTSLSATQKLITFAGQFLLINTLIESFDMKLIEYEIENSGKSTVYFVGGKSRAPSMIIEDNTNVVMRLRLRSELFEANTNVPWTGDIPLQSNSKSGQPWLVKVPLQERGQFISIWVRIVTEVDNGKTKVLGILSPLYMIQSHLPVPVTVQIETRSLKTVLSRTINGKGEKQQLYCPGTFEHFHQLTFQLETGLSASNPYVPLSYSSVDQRKFFKRPEKENIQAILKELEKSNNESTWPFQEDETCEWIAAEQPQTHVQVQYRDAGLVSSTLLLELQPWCFIMNTLGCCVSVVSCDVELCQIPHYGIVTPPKLDDTFLLGIGVGDTFYTSCPLQLAKPDWSQSFYMPRISGLIPVNGNTRTSVDCGMSVCLLNISSSMQEDMRLIRISSNFVVGNMTRQEVLVATLAVPEASANLPFPNDLTAYSTNILPSENSKQGTPVVQWFTIYGPVLDSAALYISISLGQRWSCPLRVDQSITRKCISVPNGYNTMPVVVTTQEDRNTTYIMIHPDNHPLLFIENMCSFKILVSQITDSDVMVSDCAHFSWICEVESGGTCYYSIPSISSKLPDAPYTNSLAAFVLSATNCDDNEESRITDKKQFNWSRSINLPSSVCDPTDQFVRLPYYGDVKLTMQTRCYTTYINISPISQTEISARDIRCKLIRRTTGVQSEDESELDEERYTAFTIQSNESSTSAATFFSANDESVNTDSVFSTPRNLRIRPIYLSSEIFEPADEPPAEVKVMDKSLIIYLHNMNLVLMQDANENGHRTEVASLSLVNAIVDADLRSSVTSVCSYIGDLQLDNQMFDQGGFDFPVVLINQNSLPQKDLVFYSNGNLNLNITKIVDQSLIYVKIFWEMDGRKKACKEVIIKVSPISAYIEDTYITQLLDYGSSMMPPCFVSCGEVEKSVVPISMNVHMPDSVLVDAKILGSPLRLKNFVIEPISLLLSVHTSVRLYVALDHSPLHFGTFERRHLLTTPYRLGNALTMHYLSGAIFGAGWVVGSLEILGSPGGFAQALGSGLKDFISMPFQGLLQGPGGFIMGITHGSASLMKHVTAGTVNSVTKLASSVARNLDRLTLDNEHLQRQEESRRMRPQGVAQGLYQGLTGFGMSLLAAVAGLAHHPLQQVWSGESTTKGIVTGVGLGLVGVVTKPLSGAAELVALTGQGLLQGTGWNSLPNPRQRPVVQYITGCTAISLKYAWHLMQLFSENKYDNILHVVCANQVIPEGSDRLVTLVLTRKDLLLINAVEDCVEKCFPLEDLTGVGHPSESTVLRFYCASNESPPARNTSPTNENEVCMDQQMRARVAEYVRTSSTGLTSISTNSDAQSDTQDSVPSQPENCLLFHVNSDSRSYLLSLFNIAKKQKQGSDFIVL